MSFPNVNTPHTLKKQQKKQNTFLHLQEVEKRPSLKQKLVPLYSAGEFKVQDIKTPLLVSLLRRQSWGVMVGPPPTPPAGCPATWTACAGLPRV